MSRSAASPSDAGLGERFRTLRVLLKRNSAALELLSDLEGDLEHLEPCDDRVRADLHALLAETLLMAQELNLLTGDRHRALYGALRSIEQEIERVFARAEPAGHRPLALRLDEPLAEDGLVAGGKTAGLALLRRLHPDHVPPGFVITTEAYRRFIGDNDLLDRILPLLTDIDAVSDLDLLAERTAAIRRQIIDAETPPDIRSKIEALAAEIAPDATAWAVRSSARSEDERFTFAGQFETKLGVPVEDLDRAYREVLAGRFTDRAVLYRTHCGFRDVDTPMAVLFTPMIDARAAGVLYTTDPRAPDAERMVVSYVAGLSDKMLRGETPGETVYLTRDARPRPCGEHERWRGSPEVLSAADLEELGGLALEAAQEVGQELDVEWALDRAGRLWLLQGRRLRIASPPRGRRRGRSTAPPFIERGVTVVPGRAEGPVERLRVGGSLPELRQTVPVVVTDEATPELTAILPDMAALLVRGGNPAGHVAALIREFSVPTLFQLGDAVTLLEERALVSVDASRRQVFHGRRWRGIRDRVLSKAATARERRAPGPLHDAVVALHLTDPDAPSFDARHCRSIHDVIRFVHETSIRSMFELGDRQNRFWARGARKLDSPTPFELWLIDSGAAPRRGKKVRPEEVDSRPFQALWRGVSDATLPSSGQDLSELDWMPKGFVTAVMDGPNAARRHRSANYAIVAPDYLNLNARLTFHYAMIDSVVGPGAERNHVHFRVRGGGTEPVMRGRRARFLEIVLRRSRFVTDRQGDSINAWLQGYPAEDSEEALAMLGRLLVCARRLDRFMVDDRAPRRWAAEFLAGNFSTFGYSR